METRAFRIAEIATGNKEEALDILQDAMCKLVQKYADKPASEWAPLFHSILQSRINDWYRRNAVRNRFRVWLGHHDEGQNTASLQAMADTEAAALDDQVNVGRSMERLDAELRKLPWRQRQAFLLRAWEGFDVRETAGIMRCSEGSVKTHYSRAIHRLQEKLQDFLE